MGLLRKFFSNTGKPEGVMGKIVVAMMNKGHAGIAAWGFSHLDLQGNEQVLDCGCGGGANVAVFLRMVDEGHVTGLDYSTVSVEKAREVNQTAIAAGRCEIVQGNVLELPFGDGRFDVVTAFETVYFWPEIARCFAQVHRVLKPGGMFMITNEASGRTKSHEKWQKIVDNMSVYTGEELEKVLTGAGFARVVIDEDLEHDRLNVRAYKD
ncbi:class I SAM-dependent methyltransferase [Selenomonas sp. oral taxon 138]|uniref:class I SAM-dependent methyltransferase n=1 Tax=Selenomonas sp. oral taxon 138 TaxID=712532 RepID=UPI0002A28B76|nr:class I SAM-dependent methyltransferase [Selenomonas sp. oral taxon 138]EKX96066.1 methyltransferase domain protein [Selenomonas sp. oral taxon 138 str. F0429]